MYTEKSLKGQSIETNIYKYMYACISLHLHTSLDAADTT